MKWIPVSERLPDKEGFYVLKHLNGYYMVVQFNFFKDEKGRFHQSNHWLKNVEKNEWLDESPSLSEGEEAIGFTEWASQNYGYVEENKWDGFNDETFTTTELYNLYKQSKK